MTRAAAPAVIRATEEADLPVLRDIERASGELFERIGMAEVAEEEPLSLEELTHYHRAGRAWVIEEAGRLLGFLLAEPVDSCLHIAQVSVHPRAAGRRLGQALIEHLARLAAQRAVAGLSLTTFAEVPWNAPYYRRLGFVEVAPADLGPGLGAVRALERRVGLDRWPRVAMFRPV